MSGGYRMSRKKITALRQLADVTEAFLDTGRLSGEDNENEPPDRDMVRKGGELHSAIVAVENVYGGKLPAPTARNAWLRLTIARDKIADENEWQIVAKECAGVIVGWVNELLGL